MHEAWTDYGRTLMWFFCFFSVFSIPQQWWTWWREISRSNQWQGRTPGAWEQKQLWERGMLPGGVQRQGPGAFRGKEGQYSSDMPGMLSPAYRQHGATLLSCIDLVSSSCSRKLMLGVWVKFLFCQLSRCYWCQWNDGSLCNLCLICLLNISCFKSLHPEQCRVPPLPQMPLVIKCLEDPALKSALCYPSTSIISYKGSPRIRSKMGTLNKNSI